MGIEIERKFLMQDASWKEGITGKHYIQGYLNRGKDCTVRVRVVEEQGFLTIKGLSDGPFRLEYEYEIPVEDGRELLDNFCEQTRIEKIRYKVPYAGMIWEIDEFIGANKGLIVAEIELQSVDQSFAKPPWIGAEVTDDPRYFNSCLCVHPFSRWGE